MRRAKWWRIWTARRTMRTTTMMMTMTKRRKPVRGALTAATVVRRGRLLLPCLLATIAWCSSDSTLGGAQMRACTRWRGTRIGLVWWRLGEAMTWRICGMPRSQGLSATSGRIATVSRRSPSARTGRCSRRRGWTARLRYGTQLRAGRVLYRLCACSRDQAAASSGWRGIRAGRWCSLGQRISRAGCGTPRTVRACRSSPGTQGR
mmetsp:Transcript_31146/g.101518  ORF Transcript_31146/g.101518 Transcript_31146/m.101518 type:complete len:205 (+) Transcript_31146:2069-2683(+)